jgi:hypothetical protein
MTNELYARLCVYVQDLAEGPKGLNQQNLDNGANLLISVPAPLGEFVVYVVQTGPPGCGSLRFTLSVWVWGCEAQGSIQ